ncbi:MAG: hypothetical protein EB161_06360, partial [Nitrosopumilaceae archaeon]|nr:hypothetical protein [Nitrosopumilaceae archaeon]
AFRLRFFNEIALAIRIMKMCKGCGCNLNGNAREFCSWGCQDKHITSLKEKMHHAVRNDIGHTQKLSRQ